MKYIYNLSIIKYLAVIIPLCVFIIYACSEETTNPGPEVFDYLTVPEGFPSIPFPENNPYNYDKVQLGRYLYYDNILTNDPSIKSCSHCLKQSNGFCDNKPVSIGFLEEPEYRNTMPLANAAYRTRYFWDGRGNSIEATALRSIILIYIFGSDSNVVNQRLQTSSLYQNLFKKAFGEDAVPSSYLAAQAIATFVRTFVSGNSRYDQYTRGNKNAMNESEKRGMDLFFSDRTKCSVCHSGFMFTDQSFHNTATQSHYFDRGRFHITGNMEDWAKFLTPSLRNVELTSPYMHSGEYLTLEEVLANYNMGGKIFVNKDTLIKPLNLSKQELSDIINFLKTLTDWDFVNNPKFKKPN